jgi:membrane-associated phospholipid phosphatase
MLAAMRPAPLVLVLLTSAAHAQPAEPPPQELPYSPWVDGAVIGVGALVYALSDYVFKDALAPGICRWCEPPGFDVAARDALRWDDTQAAQGLSNWVGYGAVPLAAFGTLAIAGGRDGRIHDWWIDAMIVVESTVIAMNVTQVVKVAAARERPWIHALPDDDKPLVPRPTENNLAFFSGHSSTAFAIATAAGVVASRRGYRAAPVVWGASLPLAAATAYLRMAADKHWLSDCLLGSAVGAAAGYLVPRLLHPRRGRTVEVVPTAGGVSVVGTF